MAKSDDKNQILVHFSGRVQGVGFRYTVLHLAQDLGITGYVRNLHDGRVQLLAQGMQHKLDELMNQIRRSRLQNGIQNVNMNHENVTASYKAFTIEQTE